MRGNSDVRLEVIVRIVCKLVYNLLTGRIQPTYRGEMIHLRSTTDIPVGSQNPYIKIN